MGKLANVLHGGSSWIGGYIGSSESAFKIRVGKERKVCHRIVRKQQAAMLICSEEGSHVREIQQCFQ